MRRREAETQVDEGLVGGGPGPSAVESRLPRRAQLAVHLFLDAAGIRRHRSYPAAHSQGYVSSIGHHVATHTVKAVADWTSLLAADWRILDIHIIRLFERLIPTPPPHPL